MLADWLAGRPAGWPADWLAGWRAGNRRRPIDAPTDGTIVSDRTPDRPTGRPAGQATYRPGSSKLLGGHRRPQDAPGSSKRREAPVSPWEAPGRTSRLLGSSRRLQRSSRRPQGAPGGRRPQSATGGPTPLDQCHQNMHLIVISPISSHTTASSWNVTVPFNKNNSNLCIWHTLTSPPGGQLRATLGVYRVETRH